MECGHPVRLSARREQVCAVMYRRLCVLSTLADKMSALHSLCLYDRRYTF